MPKPIASVKGYLAPGATVGVVLDEAGHGELGGDSLAEIDGDLYAEGDRVADPAFLEIHEAARPDAHAEKLAFVGTELCAALFDDADHHVREIGLVQGYAATDLGENLSCEVDRDGDVGPDLNLDAYDSPESAIHGEVDGAAPSPRTCGALGDFFYDANFDEARDLIGDGRLVEAKTLGYAHAADARILPDRPDNPSRCIRPSHTPPRHHVLLRCILKTLVG